MTKILLSDTVGRGRTQYDFARADLLNKRLSQFDRLIENPGDVG
jgi:hypothetical protein